MDSDDCGAVVGAMAGERLGDGVDANGHCGVTAPNFLAATGWLWGLIAVVVFSLAFAAPMLVIQNPVRQSYAAALTGLTLQQRTQVMKVLRRGEVPADPHVLAAAIRVAP